MVFALQNRVLSVIAAGLAAFFLLSISPAFAKSPLTKISAGSTTWTIELADDPDSRQTGLMNRRSMADKTGMLFRFNRTEEIAMWMKNTFIPLDMVFMDEAGKITHIHYNAVPQSLDIISSNGPVRYVLEINAGEAKAHGLQVGSSMQHPWFVGTN
ncbi:MAG: DUF192 domain-containing protein [Pseudomonadota bacterium]